MKRPLEEYLAGREGKAVINLGCGRANPPECFGVDILEFPGVDLVADLSTGIPVPDSTFDVALAMDFLEHIPQGMPNIRIMEEIHRILKPGGQLHFDVPSTDGNNMGAFQDPTHVSFWNQKKFQYFMADEFGEGFRSLYGIKCWFKPLRLETYYNPWNVTYVRGVLEKQK